MKETRTEVKVELVRMMCECGGEMKNGLAPHPEFPDGLICLDKQYHCVKCHKEYLLKRHYPYYEYTEVKNQFEHELNTLHDTIKGSIDDRSFPEAIYDMEAYIIDIVNILKKMNGVK